jgi:hypothetical protein
MKSNQENKHGKMKKKFIRDHTKNVSADEQLKAKAGEIVIKKPHALSNERLLDQVAGVMSNNFEEDTDESDLMHELFVRFTELVRMSEQPQNYYRREFENVSGVSHQGNPAHNQ